MSDKETISQLQQKLMKAQLSADMYKHSYEIACRQLKEQSERAEALWQALNDGRRMHVVIPYHRIHSCMDDEPCDCPPEKPAVHVENCGGCIDSKRIAEVLSIPDPRKGAVVM